MLQLAVYEDFTQESKYKEAPDVLARTDGPELTHYDEGKHTQKGRNESDVHPQVSQIQNIEVI